MMRPIDADALDSHLKRLSIIDPTIYANRGFETARYEVSCAPTIDAVQVVRCKDCIHAVAITNPTIANRCGLGQKNCMRQRGDDGFGFAGVSVVYPDGFCDEGARMDGDAK